MSTEPTPQQVEENNPSTNIEQNDKGDANLIIEENYGTAINKVGRDINFNGASIVQISVDIIHTREFITTSPYKGLKKFELEDKDLFFGRDQFLIDLASDLEKSSFILLLGASGSGKSSVVRAGLIPSLQQNLGSQLVNLTFTPDENPFEALYGKLLSKYSQQEAQIAREVKADTLIQVVKRLKQPDSYWFIFIDQFEELFTTTPEDKATEFINGLLKLASAKIANVKIVATMRADFLDKLSPYPKLVKATKNHRPMIAEMQPDELRMAIEQPAARHGVVFETGLVDEIIKDVQGQAGYLPLLQYTLNILWEEEVKSGSINDRTLNISSYRDVGGVRGALQKRVDSIYGGFIKEEKLATQKIFLKLVGIGGDLESETEWKPIRRRELRSEFETELEQRVLVKLINENLLVSDSQSLGKHQQSTVEIAHEILLPSWTTLSNWIKDNRSAIALRNRLNDDVARWKKKKADNELWDGSKLEQVLESRKNDNFNQILGGFSTDANQFIDASLKKRDRQFRRAMMLAGIGLTLAGLASAGGVFSFIQQQEALKQNIIGIIQLAESRLLTNNQLDAMVEAIKAKKKLDNLWMGKDSVSLQVLGSLAGAVNHNQKGWKERLRLRNANVIFSPDGKLLAIIDANIIRLWDIESGEQLHLLKGNENYLTSAVFSPNGKQLAAASNDNTARLWDANTGKQLYILKGHNKHVRSVVFSPDGKRVATASHDKTARLWDANTGKQLYTLKGHEDWVHSVEFSSDGKLLATASNDNTARLWDANTGKQLHTLKADENVLWSAEYSPDGKLLATISSDDTVRLWDANTRKQLHTLKGHDSQVDSVEFSPDGKLLATTSQDSTVRLWNANTGKQLHTLKGYNSYVWSVEFSPDGKLLATASRDKTARLWDVNTGDPLHTIQGHESQVYSVKFSPDGKLLVTASGDGTARLWDANTGKLLHTLNGHDSWVDSVEFSPDGKLLATTSDDNTARLWDANTGKLLHILKGHKRKVSSVEFSPDGKLLATASWDGTARLWDANTGKQLHTLKGHKGQVYSVEFSPDGKLLATPSNDETARLWDVNTGKQLHTLNRHKGLVWSVEFSPDGKRVATASWDDTARLWDANTGKQLNTLNGHESQVGSVQFSPDGKLLATASDDNTARLWRVGDIEDMLAINCDWVRHYLERKPKGDEDRDLCDGVGGVGK